MRARGAGAEGRRPSPRGMVSVELAIGIVTTTLLAAVLVTLTMLGVTQAAAAESAAQLARQVARGDDRAVQLAKDRSPGRATVSRHADGVEVTVEATSFVFGLGDVPVRASVWAAREPGARR